MAMKFRPEPEWPEDAEDLGLEQGEPGYWLGGVTVLGLPMHVEIFELKSFPALPCLAIADTYQNRIDDWFRKNGSQCPQLLELGGRAFFIHMEVYSQ